MDLDTIRDHVTINVWAKRGGHRTVNVCLWLHWTKTTSSSVNKTWTKKLTLPCAWLRINLTIGLTCYATSRVWIRLGITWPLMLGRTGRSLDCLLLSPPSLDKDDLAPNFNLNPILDKEVLIQEISLKEQIWTKFCIIFDE